MKIYREHITVQSTTQLEFMNITNDVERVVASSGIREGEVVIFAQHTTMSVIVNHHEPMLLQDFMRTLYKLVPVDDQYSHDLFELRRDAKADGRSNGHSHCKALLLGSSETIPLAKGALMLSGLQSIFAVEFDGARMRDVLVQVRGV